MQDFYHQQYGKHVPKAEEMINGIRPSNEWVHLQGFPKDR